MKSELARRGSGHQLRLSLHEGLTIGRLQDRVGLLRGLDVLRRDMDHSGSMQALDEFTQLSLGILTSGRFAAAMVRASCSKTSRSSTSTKSTNAPASTRF
mgnify:CR=1 FL=1